MTVREDLGLSETDLQDARNWYYPGWWTHVSDSPNESQLPQYRIVVCDDREEAIARASQPPYVLAEFERAEC
jgi:hypothetical protein